MFIQPNLVHTELSLKTETLLASLIVNSLFNRNRNAIALRRATEALIINAYSVIGYTAVVQPRSLLPHLISKEISRQRNLFKATALKTIRVIRFD